MRNFLCICAMLIVVTGCKPKIPSDIIQPDKTVAILHDMHIADGYISTIPNQDSAKKTAAAFYKGIYQKFDIDSVSYTRSINFYYDNPEMLTSMYIRVKAQLQKSKDSVDKIENKKLAKIAAAAKKVKDAAEKVKKDSLAKVELKRIAKLKPSERLKIENAKKKDSINKATLLKNKARPAAKKVK